MEKGHSSAGLRKEGKDVPKVQRQVNGRMKEKGVTRRWLKIQRRR
jgi:hypothetical protein